jgi:hypothetical protein
MAFWSLMSSSLETAWHFGGVYQVETAWHFGGVYRLACCLFLLVSCLAYTSNRRMVAVCSSKLLDSYWDTQCYNPNDYALNKIFFCLNVCKPTFGWFHHVLLSLVIQLKQLGILYSELSLLALDGENELQEFRYNRNSLHLLLVWNHEAMM